MVPRYPDVQFWNLDQLTYAGNLLNLSSIEHAENYSFVHSDITDLDALNSLFETHDFTTVIHFAAESHVDRSILGPVVFAETNTVGTLKLLEAARKHWGTNDSNLTDGSRRFYHVSTDEVYGSLSNEGYFTEQTPYDPRSRTQPRKQPATILSEPITTPISFLLLFLIAQTITVRFNSRKS